MTNLNGGRILAFTIPGRIGGKGRARAFVRGGKIGLFTPQKTRSQEAIVRQLASLEMRGALPMVGPLGLHIRMVRNYPQSWSNAKRATVWVTGKPDCDNVLKLISDAMNGIVYADDAQIAQVLVSRMYSNRGGEFVYVGVAQLEPRDA